MEQNPPPIRTKRGSLERMIRDDTAFAAATREFLPVLGRECDFMMHSARLCLDLSLLLAVEAGQQTLADLERPGHLLFFERPPLWQLNLALAFWRTPLVAEFISMLGDTGDSQRLALNRFGAACERGVAPPLPGGDLRAQAVHAARRVLSRDQRQRGPPGLVRQEVYAEFVVSQRVHAPAAYKALFQSYLKERFLELLADGGATTAKGRGAARKAARRMTLCGELARRVTLRVFTAGAGGFTLPPLPPAAGGVYGDAYYTGADAAIRKYAREVVAAAITAEGAAAAAAAAPKQHLIWRGLYLLLMRAAVGLGAVAGASRQPLRAEVLERNWPCTAVLLSVIARSQRARREGSKVVERAAIVEIANTRAFTLTPSGVGTFINSNRYYPDQAARADFINTQRAARAAGRDPQRAGFARLVNTALAERPGFKVTSVTFKGSSVSVTQRVDRADFGGQGPPLAGRRLSAAAREARMRLRGLVHTSAHGALAELAAARAPPRAGDASGLPCVEVGIDPNESGHGVSMLVRHPDGSTEGPFQWTVSNRTIALLRRQIQLQRARARVKGRRNLAAVVARESRLPRSKARSVAEAMHRARAVSVAFKGMYKLYTMPAWTRLKRSSDVGIEIGNPLVNRALLGMDPWIKEKVMLHNLPQFLATLPPARFAVGFGDGWNGRAMHASALGRVSMPLRALRDLFFRGGYYITSTDEFRTSMLCSRCFMVLRKVVLVAPHGAAAGTRRPSWAVVRCKRCPTFWNRDENAAGNIRRENALVLEDLPRTPEFTRVFPRAQLRWC